MNKLVVMMAAVSAIAAIIGASDASAQSWGRRGAGVRCLNGGLVQGRWYCNLKHAPPGEWNNYRSTGGTNCGPACKEGRFISPVLAPSRATGVVNQLKLRRCPRSAWVSHAGK